MDILNIETWRSEFKDDINTDVVQEYLDFIVQAVETCDPERYSEWHHILPRCLDVEKKYSDQGVRINGADHFRAHMMLVKCFNNKRYIYQLSTSLSRMKRECTLQGITPEEYEESRKLFSISRRRENLPLEFRELLSNSHKGVLHSEEWKLETSKRLKGNKFASGKIWITNGNEEKYVDDDSRIPEGWRKGRRKVSESTRRKLSENHIRSYPKRNYRLTCKKCKEEFIGASSNQRFCNNCK